MSLNPQSFQIGYIPRAISPIDCCVWMGNSKPTCIRLPIVSCYRLCKTHCLSQRIDIQESLESAALILDKFFITINNAQEDQQPLSLQFLFYCLRLIDLAFSDQIGDFLFLSDP
ncbi:unnamed protein product [Lactuca saligna]|uniref:Uncharacterized protein n=1 Tax=Lactuca saligna TaxID=75948 RepID=A0AA36A339_LACSI|nr:unnamed protein product [Lactuca saligna]